MKWDAKGAVRESVVIVVSILIAFGIDAWWDNRKEELQASAFLDALAEDLQGTRAELDRVRTLHQEVSDGADRIMRWSLEDDPIAPCRAHGDPYAFLLAHPSIDPPMGTVEAIVNSGRTDLVQNRDLLRELTRWSALVEDLQGDEAEANRHLADEVFPILRDNLDMKLVTRSGPYVWEGAGDAPVDCGLVTSRTFQSVLYRYWNYHQIALREGIPALAEALEAVERLVVEERAR